MSVEASPEEHDVRAARNQALFREVNERVADINTKFALVTPLGEFVCECADETCAERVELSVEEYEALRTSPARFAVVASTDHVDPEVEAVVEERDRYWIVEKVGTAGQTAEGLDPRS